MTVSRPECPLSEIAGPGSEDALSHRGIEGSPFVAPDRPLLALSLHDVLSWRATPPVMRPQVKAQSSRATAVTATWDGLPRPTSRAYRRWSRTWALRAFDDRRGLSLGGLAGARTDGGTVAVAPGGLDEETPHVAVAGLGDPAALLLAAARVLARHQPDEGHELARVLEAAEVADLGDQRHGREVEMPRRQVSFPTDAA